MDFYPSTQSNIDIKRFVKKSQDNKEGGFGRVYFVEEISSHKLYVAKVLNCKNTEQKINEVLDIILMNCHHPTIVKYHGFSLTDIHDENNVTIILDYCSNGSLQDKLDKMREDDDFNEMTNTVRQKILIGVSQAMKYLHNRRILHGDLKPSNVLLDGYLRPLISDFGLSRFFSQENLKSCSLFGGNLFYTAPEVISGTMCDSKSDVYSFGIMMYEIVTGEIAYPEYEKEGMNFFQFQSKVVNENFRPTFHTSVKKSIRRLIERCWSSNPSERPTFSELFNKLSRKQDQKHDQEDQEKDEDDIDEKEEEEDYFLDDVNYDEINEYVKNITNIDDQIELKKKNNCIERDKLVANIQQTNNEIEKTKDTTEKQFVSNQQSLRESETLISENEKLIDDFNTLKSLGKDFFGQIFLTEDKSNDIYVTRVSHKIFDILNKTTLRYIALLLSAQNPAILSYDDISFRKILSENHLIVTNKFMKRGTWYDILTKREYLYMKNSYSDTNKYINLLGISLGMRYLHRKNIIHGQLGLSNIFIDSNFYPYIGEFGLFKMIDKSSYEHRQEDIIFKSPEILKFNSNSENDTSEYNENEIFTMSSDVYSYSMIAYCIMSRSIPMKNESICQMMNKIIKGEHLEITNVKNVEMRKLIEMIWSSDAKERPTFDEIVERLTDPKVFTTFDIQISDIIKYLKLFPDEQKIIDKFQINMNPKLIPNYPLNIDLNLKRCFNVVLMGNVCTGKTALIETYTKKEKITDVKPTVGFKSYNDVESGIKNVHFNIIDTSGDGKYFPFIHLCLRSVSAVIFFTDVSQNKEYESLTMFLELVYEIVGKENLVFYLATTKTDLEWENTIDQIQLFAKINGLKLFITSLDDIESIDTMFRSLAHDLLEKNKDSDSKNKIIKFDDDNIQSNGKCLIQ